MGKIVRVWIDSDACLGDGFCALGCPEVFRFTEGSWRPEVRLIDYNRFDKQIREAVSVCPYEAIHIEEAQGA
jgi:ferredoxin